MKLLYIIIAIMLSMVLLIFNQQQVARTAERNTLLIHLQFTLNERGRERYLSAIELTPIFTEYNNYGSSNILRLNKFQQHLRESAKDNFYYNSMSLDDWGKWPALIEENRALEVFKAEFLARDFSITPKDELPASIKAWHEQFVARIDSLQTLNVELGQRLGNQVTTALERSLIISTVLIAAIFLLGLSAFTIHNREFLRQVKDGRAKLLRRNKYIEHAHILLQSQTEDLVADRTALKEAKQRYQSINHLLPVGFMLVNNHGKICDINSQACTLFGYNESELLSMKVEDLVPMTSRAKHDKLRQSFAHDQEPRIMAASSTLLAGQHKDGSLIPLEIGLAPITLDKEPFISISLLNVSERRQTMKQLENKNRQMDLTLEKLRHSNEQLERFAFICSHDLQEPIRMVLSFSQLLEKHAATKLDEKSLGYLQYITDGAARAREMVSDILTFCRLDQNTDAYSDVELTTICAQTYSTLSAMLNEKNAEFSWSPSLPCIRAVPSQLFQLVMNLVGNGIKFNHSEKPKVKITVEDKNGRWEIAVTDNGIGIDPKYQPKLFQIFTRLNSKNEFPGTGIGLAICKKIVEQHGALIHIESELGQGTRFIIVWPKLEEFKEPPSASHPLEI